MDMKAKRYLLLDPAMVEQLEGICRMLRSGAMQTTTATGDCSGAILGDIQRMLNLSPALGDAEVGALAEAMLGDRAYGPDHGQE